MFKQIVRKRVVQSKIERMLRRRGYGWKPLYFKRPEQCAAFALSRYTFFVNLELVYVNLDLVVISQK